MIEEIATANFGEERRPVRDWARVGPYVIGRAHPSKPGELLKEDTELSVPFRSWRDRLIPLILGASVRTLAILCMLTISHS